ncbi:Flagellin N-methylase [Planctomycetes bacterium Poly30]|uniref:Flagellin N-methylase n=1 Tax=Saltatorellus ferox TaxID=2528018 RepID=A0A518ER84_9BACT|nr:Flagellin N-methylase [Planctomycetes bacterium Poly30]
MSHNSPDESPEGEPGGELEGKTERWYEAGLPFSCTACGNCCKSNGEYSHVYLREEEVAAIADHLDVDPVLFLREQLVVEDGWISLQPDLPECQFLTADRKCGIYPVRPVQCRTWPFWEINLVETTWRKEVNGICPGSRDGKVSDLHPPDRIQQIAKATEDWYEDRLEQWPGTSHEL